eukprot:jgi/Tetstr1/437683/TSEL_000241.t1
MTRHGSPTDPKMVDVGKAADVEGVGTAITDHDPVAAARRKAEDTRLKQLTQEQLSMFFTTQETPMPPAAAGEEAAIPGGNESRAGGMDPNVPHKDSIYDANIASAAKTTGGALRRNDRDQDGGGGSRENFKTSRPVREAAAPRATFAKDATKDSSKAKVEPPSVDRTE